MAEVERTIDIVIAEKNPLLQAGLVKLLKGRERFRVAEMVDDGAAFLEAVGRTRCDVGVIGWELPNLDGRGVLTALRGRPGPRIIVYTGSSNPDLPRQAMALGAAGFASKQDRPEQLLETIDAVAAGRMAFPFVDVAQLSSDPMSSLTPRERELLEELAAGFTNQQMASRVDVSLNTVKFHLKNLYDKLGLGNRAQAVAFFLKHR
jgi:two-component system nitrate/nitrite response regulator NarP